MYSGWGMKCTIYSFIQKTITGLLLRCRKCARSMDTDESQSSKQLTDQCREKSSLTGKLQAPQADVARRPGIPDTPAPFWGGRERSASHEESEKGIFRQMGKKQFLKPGGVRKLCIRGTVRMSGRQEVRKWGLMESREVSKPTFEKSKTMCREVWILFWE